VLLEPTTNVAPVQPGVDVSGTPAAAVVRLPPHPARGAIKHAAVSKARDTAVMGLILHFFAAEQSGFSERELSKSSAKKQ
jgi:hypothetical protein